MSGWGYFRLLRHRRWRHFVQRARFPYLLPELPGVATATPAWSLPHSPFSSSTAVTTAFRSAGAPTDSVSLAAAGDPGANSRPAVDAAFAAAAAVAAVAVVATGQSCLAQHYGEQKTPGVLTALGSAVHTGSAVLLPTAACRAEGRGEDLAPQPQVAPGDTPDGPLPPAGGPGRGGPGLEHGELLTRHTIADAVGKAAPAVVNLTVSVGKGLFSGQSMGSGSIIRPDGLILTNAHVIAEFTTGSNSVGPTRRAPGSTDAKLGISLRDGRIFEGEVVGYDIPTDIALVKVLSPHGRPLEPLPVVRCGSSRGLRPGDWVVALGSPLRLHNTVTVGVVSCVDRKGAELGLPGGRTEFIQTDAAINQGNSGGPLLNLDGELVGINSMKALSADGISFAVPVDTAQHVIHQLERHGRVVRPFVGIKMLELTPAIVAQLRERDPQFPAVAHGVLVPQVIPGSPAARAGIRAGDVIVALNGQPVSTSRQIVDMLGDRVGVSFQATLRREGDTQLTLSFVTEEASTVF